MFKADRIIAVSEFAKEYICNQYPDLERKIHVVYNGNPVSVKYQNHNKIINVKGKYILTASKYVTYANQLNLLKGYNYLNIQMQNIPPLWLAGGIHDKRYFEKIKNNPINVLLALSILISMHYFFVNLHDLKNSELFLFILLTQIFSINMIIIFVNLNTVKSLTSI